MPSPVTVDATDIVERFFGSISAETHRASELSALKLAEGFSARLKEIEKERRDFPISTLLKECESLVIQLPPGSRGRARLVSMVVITASHIRAEQLRAEFVEAFIAQESSRAIAAAIVWYKAACEVTGLNPNITGLEDLYSAISKPKVRRILSGLALLDEH